MFISLDCVPDQSRYDIVVIGAGAAGMSAALFAAIENKKVLLVEHTEYVGGTSALSAATIWIPNSHHAPTRRERRQPREATTFLNGVVGNRSPAKLREAFLRSGPQAVAVLEANSDLKLRPYATHPDYEQGFEGATLRGRALEPVPFDGRALGADLHRIRPPIPEFTLFGGMMVDRTDINHLLNLTRSWKSFVHAGKILGRYGVDRLSGPRGSRLAMGNALIGRLLLSLKKRNVEVLTETSVREFIVGGRQDRGRGAAKPMALPDALWRRAASCWRRAVTPATGSAAPRCCISRRRNSARLRPGQPARCRISLWRWARGLAKAMRTMRSGRRFPFANAPMAARRCFRIS